MSWSVGLPDLVLDVDARSWLTSSGVSESRECPVRLTPNPRELIPRSFRVSSRSPELPWHGYQGLEQH